MQMQPKITETTNDRDLVRVEILCADCKDGSHGCAGLWRGIGLEIRCSCRCHNTTKSDFDSATLRFREADI
jgi:hypothetical protein